MSPALRSARSVLAPLGSPGALSWLVLAIYCPLGIAIQGVGNADLEGGPVGLWLLASAIGMVVLVAIITVVRWGACRQGDPPVLTVVGAYVLASVLQSVVFGMAALGLGASTALNLQYRPMSPFFQVPLLMAVGVWVARYLAHRRVVQALERTRSRLMAVGPSVDAELDRLEAELSGAVRASLEPAMQSLDAVLTAATGSRDERAAVAALDAAVEQQVRPISLELAGGAVPDPLPAPPDAQPVARVPLPRRFRLADGMRPALAGLVLGVIAIPTAERALEPGQVLVYVPLLALGFWGALSLIRLIIGAWRPRTTVGVTVVVVSHIAAFLMAYWALDGLGVAVPPNLGAVGSIACAAIGGLIAASMLVEARRAETEANLAAATRTYERHIALTMRRQRLVRRRLAFVIHGALQGAMYAAALRLREATVVDWPLVRSIRADLDSALAQLERPAQTADVPRAKVTIDELRAVWHGRRLVTARVAECTADALATDADADEAVAEVVREAVNNAFRHGAATRVDIDLDGPAGVDARARVVTVRVRDDGRGPSPDSSPGLGTALFDELCESWEHRDEHGESVFRAHVVVA